MASGNVTSSIITSMRSHTSCTASDIIQLRFPNTKETEETTSGCRLHNGWWVYAPLYIMVQSDSSQLNGAA